MVVVLITPTRRRVVLGPSTRRRWRRLASHSQGGGDPRPKEGGATLRGPAQLVPPQLLRGGAPGVDSAALPAPRREPDDGGRVVQLRTALHTVGRILKHTFVKNTGTHAVRIQMTPGKNVKK